MISLFSFKLVGWFDSLLYAGGLVRADLHNRLREYLRKQDEQNAAVWRELSSLKAAIAEIGAADEVPVYVIDAHNILLLHSAGGLDKREEWRLADAVAGVEEYQSRIYERESLRERG